jgi:hypothetical protein
MYSTYSTVSIDDVINLAKQRLGILHTTEYDNLLEREIEKGLHKLNVPSMVKKDMQCIEICDGKAKLPYGLYKIVGTRFIDENGNCQRMIYADADFAKQCGCDNSLIAGNTSFSVTNFFETYQVQDGYIVFPSSVPFTHITISFLKYITNSEGRLQILERYEEALACFAAYWIAFSFKNSISQNWTEQQRTELWGHYLASKRFIKGEDRVNLFELQRREFAEAWLALQISPITYAYK